MSKYPLASERKQKANLEKEQKEKENKKKELEKKIRDNSGLITNNPTLDQSNRDRLENEIEVSQTEIDEITDRLGKIPTDINKITESMNQQVDRSLALAFAVLETVGLEILAKWMKKNPIATKFIGAGAGGAVAGLVLGFGAIVGLTALGTPLAAGVVLGILVGATVAVAVLAVAAYAAKRLYSNHQRSKDLITLDPNLEGQTGNYKLYSPKSWTWSNIKEVLGSGPKKLNLEKEYGLVSNTKTISTSLYDSECVIAPVSTGNDNVITMDDIQQMDIGHANLSLFQAGVLAAAAVANENEKYSDEDLEELRSNHTDWERHYRTAIINQCKSGPEYFNSVLNKSLDYDDDSSYESSTSYTSSSQD